MRTIPFPFRYKKALLNKTKNTTIRVSKEVGKYKKGRIYVTESYAGRNWGVKIKINDVVSTKLGDLKDFGIPKQSINAILKQKGISLKSKADLIRFEII